MVSEGISRPKKWYNNYNFPVIPEFTHREGDKHNISSYSLSWLFFKFWTLDSFEFEIAFTVSQHWGVGFIGLLPYLRFAVCVPFPEKINTWVQRNLWRKPKQSKQ